MRRALSHIERHKQVINTSNNSDDNDFHKLLLQFSYEVYERINTNHDHPSNGWFVTGL